MAMTCVLLGKTEFSGCLEEVLQAKISKTLWLTVSSPREMVTWFGRY
jgi:hypothetical protein